VHANNYEFRDALGLMSFTRTQRRDEIAPKLGGLPSQEEEPEEPDDDTVHLLVGELGVHGPGLREVRGLGRPHGRGAQAHEHAGRHQRVEPRVELGADVRYVAQHGQAQRPLDGQPLDEERGHEYAAEHQRRVDGGQRHGAQALARVDRTLQVGRALERGELDHERQADGGHVLQDPPLLFGRHLELALGLVVVAVAVGHAAERRLGKAPVAGLQHVIPLEALVLVAADH